MTTIPHRVVPSVEPVDLARPFSPQRLRLYLTIGSLQGVAGVICAVGVGIGVLEPDRALDVVANILNFIPMVLLPALVVLLVRDPLTRSAELTLVWLPFTAAAQLSFELAWLIGQLFDVWKPSHDPGWTWMWWQFALADTRYFGENPYIFGIEVTAVAAAAIVLVAFRRLLRPELGDRERVRSLFLAALGLVVLTANTLTYFTSAARNGLEDVGQGDYGLVKFVALNGPYLIVPVFVLIAMWHQIDHLHQRAAGRPEPREEPR